MSHRDLFRSSNEPFGKITDMGLIGQAASERNNYPPRSEPRQVMNNIVHANDHDARSDNPFSGPEDKTEEARRELERVTKK